MASLNFIVLQKQINTINFLIIFFHILKYKFIFFFFIYNIYMKQYKIFLAISHDRKLIKQILLDKNGWASKFDISFTENKKDANVMIYSCSNIEIKKKFDNNFGGFSVCDRGKSPHEIYINLDRWFKTPHNFKIHKKQIIGGDRDKSEQLFYRQYVLQHELGHSIDLADHVLYDKKSNKHFGPVMFQQTRGNIINDKILYIPNPWIVLNYQKFNKENLKKFKVIQQNYL